MYQSGATLADNSRTGCAGLCCVQPLRSGTSRPPIASGRNGCGRVPDASHTIAFEEMDASRTRPERVLGRFSLEGSTASVTPSSPNGVACRSQTLTQGGGGDMNVDGTLTCGMDNQGLDPTLCKTGLGVSLCQNKLGGIYKAGGWPEGAAPKALQQGKLR
eukprot:gene9861-biopygen21272